MVTLRYRDTFLRWNDGFDPHPVQLPGRTRTDIEFVVLPLMQTNTEPQKGTGMNTNLFTM